MSGIGGFGWKEGSNQLGSYRLGGGLGFIFAPRGDRDNPTPGTVWAWVLAGGPYTQIRMLNAYYPAAVSDYPVRAAVNGGDVCEFPSIEATALIAAGIAVAA